MRDRVFVDTNVLVYLFDTDAPEKQAESRSLLERLGKQAGVVLSTQVLQEFYVSVTRKLARPLPPADALKAARDLSAFHVVQVDPPMIFRAIGLSQQEQTSFWDALIIRAALESDCAKLMSEDLQHGRQFENLVIHNPFH